MSLLDLSVLYALAGAGCAVLVYRQTAGSHRRRAASAALALPLWPIWAPLALVSDPPRRTPASGRAARVEMELDRAVEAATGSPFAILLPPEAADRIRREIRHAVQRIDELDAVLAQPGFDLAEAERRVTELSGPSERGTNVHTLRTAVLHRDNVARLEALRDRHARSLEELGGTVGALRSQLVLARYAGSSAEGVGGIVAELWARVEGLGEALDAETLNTETLNAETDASE